jgi:cell division protein FtsW (lipid II flippase)
MHRHEDPPRVTEVRPGLSERQRLRRRWYFAIMGVCLLLIVLAWNVVRFWSTTAAVVMSMVAAVLPPIAAVVANWHADRR